MAWRIAYIMAAVGAIAAIAAGGFFLAVRLYLSYVTLPLSQHGLWWLSLCCFLSGAYMFAIYRLLRRPASIAYFARGDGKGDRI